MVLLFKVLLKPANMVLEIAYLDRSEGDQVNVHRMPDEANGKDAASVEPMIQLLYRPGHYDILYRNGGAAIQIPPIPSGPTSIQVNRVTSLSHQHDIHQSSVSSLQDYATLDMTALAMIPAMGPPSISSLGSPPSDCSPIADAYTPPPYVTLDRLALLRWTSSGAAGFPPAVISPTPAGSHAAYIAAQLVAVQQVQLPAPGMGESPSSGSPTTAVEPTFTTSMFKNSHFNTAHYNNPHFQPEEYKPENDEDLQPTSSNSSRHGGGRKRSH
ncbi:Ubiquitin thioesterase OTUB1 [Apiospora phragmitis]|uniref:Ubiquitin thioesterase OTUB1 n=1 Tax=Apiospora phragmitis TaxID=2905665 RepID=A0ABR1UV61_9PEZI